MSSFQCHYEVLSVSRDADDATIKKAYRKLALRWHPDKNSSTEEATHQFRLVQQAYECLSDTTERRWYDEHRDAILRGWSSSGGGPEGRDEVGDGFLYDVIPFQYAGCYSGYDDGDDDGFYAVYGRVFAEVLRGEREGYKSEGNVDDCGMADLLSSTDFGDSTTPWAEVSSFYSSWESFSSGLAYAWEDKYDVREAPNRRVRRAMEDENRKARRSARRTRNDDVLSLVRFVKRRDPRVKHRQMLVDMDRRNREAKKREEEERKKVEMAARKEVWREEAAKAMAEVEEADRNAGRVRLADLEDDDDFFDGGKKKGRKGKRGKKGKNKKGKGRRVGQEDSDDEDSPAQALHRQEQESEPNDSNCLSGDEAAADDNNGIRENGTSTGGGCLASQQKACVPDESNGNDPNSTLDGTGGEGSVAGEDDGTESSEDVESSGESEPDVWRCECCRKDFKSENQMENHMKSKKHREAFKKYEKKLGQRKQKMEKEEKEQAIMEDLLDDLDLET